MIKLNKFFAPTPCSDMIRLGSEYDGGYVLPRSIVDSASMLLSFGVNDDWSLEKDFLKEADYLKIHCFDASISRSTFILRAVKSLLKLNIKSSFKYCQTFFDFNIFFRTKAKHHKKYISDHNFGDYIDFNEVKLSIPELENICEKKVVLKIDIEGEEYRLLEAILECKNIYSCILIEFHDFDLHQDLIKKFTKDLGFKIVNFHANNCAPLNKHSVPLVVEITYVSNEFISESSTPHKLNSPCCPIKDEYNVYFE
jgi:hypothetical protein